MMQQLNDDDDSEEAMMNLINQIGLDSQGNPSLTHLMEFSKVTLDREAVLGQFLQDSTQFLSASKDQDQKRWKELTVEAEACWKEAGPEVVIEICQDNRIGLQTLEKVKGSATSCQLGKFLLCRTLSAALNGAWLEVVVEDPSGQSGVLLLTNFTPSKYSKDVGRQGENNGGSDESRILGALPPGSLVVVKNAYAVPRVPVMGRSLTFLLQVASHNPADVVLLTPKKMKEFFPDLVWHGPIPRESFWDVVLAGKSEAEIIEALKRKGNEAFIFKRYTDAIRCYDLALDYIGGGNDVGGNQFTTIFSNKSASFLGLGCFLKALESADKALLRDPLHVKAIYRKVRAMVGLSVGPGGCFDAAAFLNGKFVASPSLKQNQDLLKLMEMIPLPGKLACFDCPCSLFEHFEDFGVGSSGPIEYRPNPITGRGVFATQDIEPVHFKLCTQRSLAKVGSVGKQHLSYMELIGCIANKIAFSPELGPEFYSLWAGKELGKLDPEDPAINRVNICRIQAIVNYHSRYSPIEPNVRFPYIRYSGIWGITPFLSQLNHSCSEANVVNHQHENWNYMVASKPIKKGDEIFTHWIDVMDSLPRRQKTLEHLVMVCHCSLCRRDSEDGFEVKRKFTKLWTRFSQFTIQDYETNSKKVDSALKIINQIAALRPDAPHLIPIMLHPAVATLFDVMFNEKKYFNNSNYMVKYVELGKKMALMAETMNDLRVVLAVGMNVLRVCLKHRNLKDAKEWARKVKQYKMIFHRTSHVNWDSELLAEMREAGLNPAKL